MNHADRLADREQVGLALGNDSELGLVREYDIGHIFEIHPYVVQLDLYGKKCSRFGLYAEMDELIVHVDGESAHLFLGLV